MNASENYYIIDNLNNTILYIYKYIVTVIYILANIGNLLSALVFVKKSWRKNVCVFYFKVCLLFNTCFINSSVLGTMLGTGFNIHLENSNIVLCKLFIYATLLFQTLFPNILILASIDRLLISSQHVDTRLYSSKRLAYFSISISTIFWMMYYVHLLIKVNIQEMYPFPPTCYFDLSKSYLAFIAYSIAGTNFIGCLLMIILCSFAFKNVRHIRAIPRDKRHQIRSMTKKDFQLLRCLFAQDVLYIIFSTVLIICNIYRLLTSNQILTLLEGTILHFLGDLSDFLFMIPYVSNFVVFMIVSKAFRHEVKRIIYKFIGKNVNPMREEDNKQENIEQNNIELNVVSTIHLPA